MNNTAWNAQLNPLGINHELHLRMWKLRSMEASKSGIFRDFKGDSYLGCASWWANEQWMTIFPTKWRANEQQGGGWAPTSYVLEQLFLWVFFVAGTFWNVKCVFSQCFLRQRCFEMVSVFYFAEPLRKWSWNRRILQCLWPPLSTEDVLANLGFFVPTEQFCPECGWFGYKVL